MESRWTVYCHIHAATGRRYVGLTKKTLLQRWNQHVYTANRTKVGKGVSHFANAIRAYGKEAFSHEVLGFCNTLEEANLLEEDRIEFYDTRNPAKGFNLVKGGSHVPHPIKNPWDRIEYREKALENLKNIHQLSQTAEARFKRKSTFQTSESRSKRSDSSKETRMRPEVKSRCDGTFSGKHHKYETKKKIASSLLGRKLSEAHCAKISAIVGSRDQHIIERIASSNTGRKQSTESKVKIRAINEEKRRIRALLQERFCRKHGLVPINECHQVQKRGHPYIICGVCYSEQKIRSAIKQRERRRKAKFQ